MVIVIGQTVVRPDVNENSAFFPWPGALGPSVLAPGVDFWHAPGAPSLSVLERCLR
ncbi:Threonine--tRNA ligase [Clarias magur]|uniref:Threonine--tRNA ligase n=1 Tax=Clarias magur TaxID=1594786 RepID=A0A8J4TL85_CLAMG|nr:Threonine--tRNA ligase [Clarias magur]